MITIKDFNQITDHRVTEGSKYCWNCYGPNAYYLDYCNGDYAKGFGVTVIFDTNTQQVYEATVCDYKNNRAYRKIDPNFVSNYRNEAETRQSSPNQAWDNVDYIDLELDEDFLEKAKAIANGVDYDTRVMITIDLPSDTLFELMIQAHERDITVNQYVEKILKKFINKS